MGQVLQQRYELLHELGRGAFAVSHLARDRATGGHCVAKVLSLAQAQSPRAHELFEREAKVLANLDHPRVPKFTDFFTEQTADDVRVVLVQEFLPGVDLARRVRESGRLPEVEAIAIGVDLARVLEYLHAFLPPILHRDVKPSNVLIGPDGSARLIDFGAVRDKVLHDPLLGPGGPTVVGTFGYMPPEQLHGLAEPASDVYSLAATLVHALSGLEPWELDKDAMRPVLRPRVPACEELLRVLERALEPDRRRRTATARQFREALERVASRPPRKPLAVRTAVRGLAVITAAVAGAAWLLSASPAAEPRAPGRATPGTVGSRPAARPQAMPSAPLRLHRSVAWPQGARDAAGDPLLPGVVRRLGTVRLRHGGPVRSLAFTADGRGLLSAGDDRSVALWDAATGALRRRFEVYSPVMAIRASKDGGRLAASLGDRNVRVFDLGDGRELARLIVPSAASDGLGLRDLEFDPGDSSRLATLTGRGVLDLWRVVAAGGGGHERRIVPCEGPARGLTYVNDGPAARVEFACGREIVTVDPRGGTVVARRAVTHGQDRMLRTPEGYWWATTTSSHVARIDATADKVDLELPRLPDNATSLALAADGHTVFAGLADGSAMAFDATTGLRRQAFEGHHGPVLAMAASLDGRLFATGGADHTLQLFEQASGAPVVTGLQGHRHAVEALAFSVSGGTLYSGGADGQLVEWGPEGRLRSVQALSGAVMLVAPWGPTRLLVGERERLGRDDALGLGAVRRLRVFDGHGASRELALPPQAWGVAHAPGVARVAAASATSVHRYSLASEEHMSFPTPARELPVAFSPDGRVLATLRAEGGYPRALVLRDADTGRQLAGDAPASGGPGPTPCRGADGSFLLQGGSLYRVGHAPQPLLQYAGAAGGGTVCAVSPDAQRLALVDGDRIQLREVRSVGYGRGWEMWRLAWLRGHRGPVTALAFSPDARFLATGGADTQVLVWDLDAVRRGVSGALEYFAPTWPPLPAAAPASSVLVEIGFDAPPRGVAPILVPAPMAAAAFVPTARGRALDSRSPLVYPEGVGIALGDNWSFEATFTLPAAAFPLPPYLVFMRSEAVHLYVQEGKAQLGLGFLNQGGGMGQDLQPWTGALRPGVPYHLALTYERASGGLRICVDAACAPGSQNFTLADRVGELVLGDRDARGPAFTLIDDVRFHSRVLSDAEIARGAGARTVRARDVEARQ